ncbi:MAG: amidohydrolase family protein [Bacillota bacterium]
MTGRPDLVLVGGAVLDGDGRYYARRNVAIQAGRITAVWDPAGGSPWLQAEQVLDCTGCLITPGLTVLHGHAPMALFRGLAEDVAIDDWFNRRIWPYESRITPDDVYHGARLAIAEMIENGVTAFADHYMHAGRIADAVVETGIRADLAPTIFGLGDGVEEQIEAAAALIALRRFESPRLTFRMGPHAPYTCPPPVLKAIVDRARELGVGIHLHVSETEAQVAASRSGEGRTPFQAVADAGGFTLPVLVAHGLWVEEEDLALLTPETWFAASPKTYLKLAMGEGNLWRLRERLNVAIGTDGAASSNTLNPLEQARLWALVGKHATGRADRFTLAEAWQLLMNGHRALATPTGMVVSGLDADLVVWDLQQPNTAPVLDPLAALLYSAESRNVRDVMVQGQFLKRNFRVVSLDTAEAVSRAVAAAQRLLAEGPGRAGVVY